MEREGTKGYLLDAGDVALMAVGTAAVGEFLAWKGLSSTPIIGKGLGFAQKVLTSKPGQIAVASIYVGSEGFNVYRGGKALMAGDEQGARILGGVTTRAAGLGLGTAVLGATDNKPFSAAWSAIKPKMPEFKLEPLPTAEEGQMFFGLPGEPYAKPRTYWYSVTQKPENIPLTSAGGKSTRFGFQPNPFVKNYPETFEPYTSKLDIGMQTSADKLPKITFKGYELEGVYPSMAAKKYVDIKDITTGTTQKVLPNADYPLFATRKDTGELIKVNAKDLITRTTESGKSLAYIKVGGEGQIEREVQLVSLNTGQYFSGGGTVTPQTIPEFKKGLNTQIYRQIYGQPVIEQKIEQKSPSDFMDKSPKDKFTFWTKEKTKEFADKISSLVSRKPQVEEVAPVETIQGGTVTAKPKTISDNKVLESSGLTFRPRIFIEGEGVEMLSPGPRILETLPQSKLYQWNQPGLSLTGLEIGLATALTVGKEKNLFENMGSLISTKPRKDEGRLQDIPPALRKVTGVFPIGEKKVKEEIISTQMPVLVSKARLVQQQEQQAIQEQLPREDYFGGVTAVVPLMGIGRFIKKPPKIGGGGGSQLSGGQSFSFNKWGYKLLKNPFAELEQKGVSKAKLRKLGL
jgi:hypothetical protein